MYIVFFLPIFVIIAISIDYSREYLILANLVHKKKNCVIILRIIYIFLSNIYLFIVEGTQHRKSIKAKGKK